MTDQSGSAGPIRVVAVDDHVEFREGLAALLARAADIALVGEAGTGEEAVRLVHLLLPDVVLMDLQMPGLSGIEATRAIVAQHPQVGVIVLTMFEDDDSVFSALRVGARGYVLKDASRGAVLRAIRAVASGEALLGQGVARRVLEHFAPGSRERSPERSIGRRPLAGVDQLTPREQEVLELIAQGRRNREIAEALVISERTVGNHISNIFSKLQVADRAQAIIRARNAGLGLDG